MKPRVVGVLLLLASSAHAQVTSFATLPEVVDAGGLYTVQYRFTIGAKGLAQGGGVRVEIPVAYAETEALLWSAPQTDRPTAPGYVTATASNNARPRVRIAGLLRGIIETEFDDAVPAGTTVTIRYRGQVQGIAGQIDARYQSRVSARDTWVTPPRVPRITIRPARAEVALVNYPSDVVRNTPFALSVVMLDRYGNVATGFTGTVHLRSTDSAVTMPSAVTFRDAHRGRVVAPAVVFRTAGFQKIMATPPTPSIATPFKYAMVHEREPALLHLFGDTHFHSGAGAQNRGFFTVSGGADVNTTATSTFKEMNLAGDHRANFTRADDAYRYARDVMHLDFANTAEHSAPLLTPLAWRASQDISDAFNVPGQFTTFYGFEWTPDLNHYVVMYKGREGMPIGHDSLPDYPALARALQRQGVPTLTIPHVSWPFANHNIWQDSAGGEYRRVGEIYSLWNSRHLVQPDDEPQLFELGDTNQWSYQYAWRNGHKLGVIGASDNHLGHPGANNSSVYVRHSGGLAGVLASRNTRDDVWKSLFDRATYATTGTQIYVDFASDGHVMGSEYQAAAAPRLIGRIGGTNRLALVEVIRLTAGRYSTVFRATPDRETFSFDMVDRDVVGDAMYYLRVKQVEEYPGRLYSHATAEMAWSSPIWVHRRP
ncbi:MAG: DUF3604 domain-containing protein [Gemmatimonadaceae bacterium]|nr:DUF3604 domain-containing protein [Gemmatimonadaceae bacterium]